MKLEVIDRLRKEEVIETYAIQDVSMLDFQEWKDLIEVVVFLNQLSNVVAKLNSIDPETDEPTFVAKRVDFYLPDPLKDKMLEQLAKRKMDMDTSSRTFADLCREVTEQVSAPPLKLSTILSAVVVEILQNHQPHKDYEVRISDE